MNLLTTLLTSAVFFLFFAFTGGLILWVSARLIKKVTLSYVRALAISAFPAFILMLAFNGSFSVSSSNVIQIFLLAFVMALILPSQFILDAHGKRVSVGVGLLIGLLNVWFLFWLIFFVFNLVPRIF